MEAALAPSEKFPSFLCFSPNTSVDPWIRRRVFLCSIFLCGLLHYSSSETHYFFCTAVSVSFSCNTTFECLTRNTVPSIALRRIFDRLLLLSISTLQSYYEYLVKQALSSLGPRVAGCGAAISRNSLRASYFDPAGGFLQLQLVSLSVEQRSPYRLTIQDLCFLLLLNLCPSLISFKLLLLHFLPYFSSFFLFVFLNVLLFFFH